ncbi:hypothetical protein AMR72_03895 [Flavobacterium psychrophilum]|nr:hypothetical protein AMR72_03895 [Flavobacterium psychrophilum]AOE51731.1 hypothetical protein ALW18_03890 [Flavobacterium psychrophilum]
MKLSETELQDLAQQLRCPNGDNGLKVGEMMNFTNSNIISRVIDSLNLQHNDSILEIGPGNGAHVSSFINNASEGEYHGIDISELMLSEASNSNAAFKNVFFQHTNGSDIPFEENRFNKIFTANTIYFWDEPQAFADEIARVLKTGGILSIGFIPESTMKKIPFAKYGFTLYSIPTVTKLLENAGFIVEAAVTDTEFVTSNSGEKIEREFVILTAKKSQ